MADSIRPRGNSLQVRVSAGIDPVTGKQRWLSETVKGAGKSAHEQAVRVRKRLRNTAAEMKAAGEDSASSMTVGEALDGWLAAESPEMSPNSSETCRHISTHYLKALRATPLSALSVSAIDVHYRLLRSHGVPGMDEPTPLAPSTVRRVHGVLHRALYFACKSKWVSVNAATLADVPEVKRINRKMPDPKVVQGILGYYTTTIPEMALALRLLAITGARRGEVCGIRWSDVDTEARAVLIARSVALGRDEDGHQTVFAKNITKTGENRRIGIDDETAEMVKAHWDQCRKNAEASGVELADGFLFSAEVDCSVPWLPSRITRGFIRARRKIAKDGAESEHLRLGDLRHYVASQLLASGIDPLAVSARLGNSPRTLLSNYSHMIAAKDHESADHMAGLFRTK
jgi:integrase